jgi:23S rRNA (pseudouridine1915-N3)-methyltransferase
MKLTIIFTGKTKIQYVEEGVKDYYNRLIHYVKTEIIVIPDLKNTKSMPEAEIKKKEGDLILARVPNSSHIILLDERGKQFSSTGLAGFFQDKIKEGRDFCLIIGGAYGFSDQVIEKSHLKISLSRMTFSHQMVRMILLEQIYRAFTILKGEKYHHR